MTAYANKEIISKILINLANDKENYYGGIPHETEEQLKKLGYSQTQINVIVVDFQKIIQKINKKLLTK
jgi:hypothetical protein